MLYFNQLKDNYTSYSEMDYVRYSLGRCYEAQKVYSLAHVEYEYVIDQFKDSQWCDDACYRNGYIYFSEHRFRKAKRQLNMLLERYPASPLVEQAQYNLEKIGNAVGK